LPPCVCSPLSAPFSCSGTAPSQLSTLSLHDALPILLQQRRLQGSEGRLLRGHRRADPRCLEHRRPPVHGQQADPRARGPGGSPQDRKSTRLNSSHVKISYAVFCLKKKKITKLAGRAG